MGINQSKKIFKLLDEQKIKYDELLKLPTETAGYLNIKTGEWKHTSTSKGLTFKALTHYPISSDIITWHTHPDTVEDKIRKDGYKYPFSGIPSHIDILTSIKASIYYKEPSVDVIISKHGVCIYYPNEKIGKRLLGKPENDLKVALRIIKNNLAVIYHSIFSDSQRQLEHFKKEVKDLINIGEGIEIKFHPWK
jgi:hypothetical protein